MDPFYFFTMQGVHQENHLGFTFINLLEAIALAVSLLATLWFLSISALF